MQSDAHVTFVQDWDEDIISQQEATGNEMAVLTTYLTDIVGSIDKEGRSLRETRPISELMPSVAVAVGVWSDPSVTGRCHNDR